MQSCAQVFSIALRDLLQKGHITAILGQQIIPLYAESELFNALLSLGGEAIQVREGLQKAGMFDLLRNMVFESIEEVAGQAARQTAEKRGLRRLHAIVEIPALTEMDAVMAPRARLLAPKVVEAVAQSTLGLGPDVYFEDGPNVRIFCPQDFVETNREQFETFRRIIGGGRLTIHGPHQDDRLFHPKRWYNYWRPSDCTTDGPPQFAIDYSEQPSRGPVTIDTSGHLPLPVRTEMQPVGNIRISSGMVQEGEVRPISKNLCVTRIEGKPLIFSRLFPHQSADLSGASISGGQIVCPWHGLRLNTVDGQSGCRTLPPLGLISPEGRGANQLHAARRLEAINHDIGCGLATNGITANRDRDAG